MLVISVCVLIMDRKVKFQNVPNKQCIIEFQSFWGNANEFIVKELVIHDLETNVVNYFLFKPPFPFKKLTAKAKRTNHWLTKKFHYISWDEGFTQYKELNNILFFYCQQYGTIYTTGEQKVKFIAQYTTNTVINYIISRNFVCDTGEGFCNSVQHYKHKLANCSLANTYRILASMQRIQNSRGGKDYIDSAVPLTYHESQLNSS